MKIFLAVAFLAVTAFAIDPIIKEGCGCCWPLPESCCPETTTTATTTDATQPPTTTPTPAPPEPGCDCESDAVILVDRTGSVEDLEVQTVETFVLDLVTTMGVPGGVACHKWAFSAFANRAPMDVNFGDAASSNIAAFALAITPIDPPSGNSNLGSAFLGARAQFVNGPVTAGAEHVVVFITDGGSDDKANTILRAEKLANDTDARVCIVRMKDPRENGTQLMQRDQEFIDMVAASNPGSAVTGMWDFTGGIPPNAAFIDDVINCICPASPSLVPLAAARDLRSCTGLNEDTLDDWFLDLQQDSYSQDVTDAVKVSPAELLVGGPERLYIQPSDGSGFSLYEITLKTRCAKKVYIKIKLMDGQIFKENVFIKKNQQLDYTSVTFGPYDPRYTNVKSVRLGFNGADLCEERATMNQLILKCRQ